MSFYHAPSNEANHGGSLHLQENNEPLLYDNSPSSLHFYRAYGGVISQRTVLHTVPILDQWAHSSKTNDVKSIYKKFD